jgi:hypothetical protein
MKELLLTVSDPTYERLKADAAAVQKSPEQWIIDKLSLEDEPQTALSSALLTAALDALGFQRLEEIKAKRLSELLTVRKERSLSSEEINELNALMTEADALEIESLQRLAATLER